MIRPFPCVRLARTQTAKAGEIGKRALRATMRFRYIHYGIFQLSPILSLVHNTLRLLYFSLGK